MADPKAVTAVLPRKEPEEEPLPLGVESRTDLAADSERRVVVSPGTGALSEALGVARYEELKLLGGGGMGEVRLCRDVRIGREVARKVMRQDAAGWEDAFPRFVREARVQGQLEHPVVVPVYELGEESGRPFFTMKRVRGQTLGEVLKALGDGDPETARHYTRRRLLSAFSQVCLAVDFAHSRGVLHRDLKPDNVMLGDFGEVHLIDWGLARVIGVAESSPAQAISTGHDGATRVGEVMGTPGYMAPEQARGELDKLSARTDVYGLGAILFQMLTLEPLNGIGTADARIKQTLEPKDLSPRARAPQHEIPPELDALVVQACALDPEARLPSARRLSEAIESFLDGDRDQQRRVELARGHVERARDAMERDRAEAMREVTHALALAPGDADAVQMLARLLTEMPKRMPPEAQKEMEAAQEEGRVRVAGVAAARTASWLTFVPLVWWMGVRDWPLAIMVMTFLLASLLLALFLRYGRTGVSNTWSVALLLVNSVAVAGVSFVLGPFVLAPALAATNTVFFALYLSRAFRPLAAVAGMVAMLFPILLEALGLIPHSFLFEGGKLSLLPRLADLSPTPTLVVLLLSSAALAVTPIVLIGRIRERLGEAERRLFLHAWHLRALQPRR